MADIRIKDLATTAASTASDDFLAVDGSANGTRKLNAFSPTFGGNVVATGTLTVNSTTDSSSKDTGAIVTEGGLGVEKSATIGGNLTVSGTGTSSVAGALSVAELLSAKSGHFTGSTAPTTGAGVEVQYFSGIGKVISYDRSLSAWKPLQIDASYIALGSNNGNVLIGTTTDGGQKLQVNGTISGYNTSASTPTLLLNSNQPATGITLKSSVGAAAERSWAITTNTTSYGDFQIRVGTSNTADPITSGTAALTLDSSQNATFAGRVTLGTSMAFLSATSGKAIINYNSVGGLNFTGAGSVNDLTIYNKDGNVVVENPTGTTTFKLGGALRLSNAYTAGAPTATGYVTIQDSAGNTYKVLVGT